MPWPDLLSLPCRASSSHTACGNWFGGVMATISDFRPLVSGLAVICDSASRRVSFNRFLNALRACLSSSDVGEPCAGGVLASVMVSSFGWLQPNDFVSIQRLARQVQPTAACCHAVFAVILLFVNVPSR